MGRFLLNFAPLSLRGDATVLIGRQPYDRDRLNELRAEFRDTHVFQRNGTMSFWMSRLPSAQSLSATSRKRRTSSKTAGYGPRFCLRPSSRLSTVFGICYRIGRSASWVPYSAGSCATPTCLNGSSGERSFASTRGPCTRTIKARSALSAKLGSEASSRRPARR
jgi:hypothetical protein